jgi:uncharacterized protein (TIGR03083 family)
MCPRAWNGGGVGDPSVAAMNAAELTEFVALTRGLTSPQWESASLCEGWSVGDVVIHVANHIHRSSINPIISTARAGFSPERAARIVLEQNRGRSQEDVIEWLDQPLETRSLVQLNEMMIHQQDVRRPLGLVRDIPPDRVTAALAFALSRKGNVAVAGARKRADGLRLVADDVAWSFGAGDEVHGPAEAILMAVNGRGSASRDLSGDGVSTLSSRCS